MLARSILAASPPALVEPRQHGPLGVDGDSAIRPADRLVASVSVETILSCFYRKAATAVSVRNAEALLRLYRNA